MTEEERANEIARSKHFAARNEASALGNAREEGEKAVREKWQSVIAEKEAVLADKDAQIAKLLARLSEK